MVDIVVILACLLAAGGWWLLIPLRAVLNSRKLGALSAMPYEEPGRWPAVSVLVPARNEEHALAPAVQSLLEVDYPELEVILINDRSTDRTGEIIDRLARQDERIRALHIEALPPGWLGKVHALQRGFEVSRGEWLLFTDADIHFSTDVLKRGIAYCLRRQRGFLALLPRFRNTTTIIGATQAAFGTMLLSLLDFARIADPGSPMAMGIGAFNLAKRSYLETGEGLEWLRMEVADDAGLAVMMKSSGARIELLSGQDMIEVDWYPTLSAMLDGVMQRFIMGANYRLSLYLLQCAGILFCLLAPLGLAFALATYTPLAWLGLGFYVVPAVLLGVGLRNFVLPRGLLWALPIGYLLIAYGMSRSIATCVLRGGIYWRGSVYPLRELRASQRVKINALSGRMSNGN